MWAPCASISISHLGENSRRPRESAKFKHNGNDRNDVPFWRVLTTTTTTTTATRVVGALKIVCSCGHPLFLTMTTTTTTTTTTVPIRFPLLLRAIDKTLSESRAQVDSREAVRGVYGEDASIFGGEDILEKVLDGMMDNLQKQVKDDMQRAMVDLDVEERLMIVETILQRFEQEALDEREADRRDKESARDALMQVRLPKGVTPLDLVQYHAMQVMQEQRQSMQERLSNVESDVVMLEKEIAALEKETAESVQVLRSTDKAFNNMADVCSTVS